MKRKIGVLLLIVSLLAGCSVSVSTFPRYGSLQGTVQVVDRGYEYQSMEGSGLIDPQDIVIAPQGYFDDDHVYKALEGALVEVDGKQIITGGDGRFFFRDLTSGQKRVRVSSSKLTQDLEFSVYVEPGKTTETRFRWEGVGYYLVIGIEDYWYEENSPGSRRDARDMHSLFRNNNDLYGTVKPFNDPLLDGKATKDKIKEMVQDIARVATPKDYIVIYFSGHMGRDYLSPYDANREPYDSYNPWKDVIMDAELEEWLRPFEGHATLILEGPESGTFANGEDHGSYTPFAFKKGKYTVLSSASFGQDDHVIRDGNGLFTHYLIEGLRKPREIDIDRNGKITAKEIYDYVYPKVKRRSYGTQTPQLWPDNADTVIYSYR